jgi:hypothetical protein
MFPDDAGLIHPRMLAKYPAGAPNAGAVERALVAHRAPPRADGEDRTSYLDRLLSHLTVPFQHSGLHRYAFAIGPHARAMRIAQPALPYPGRVARS